MANRSETLGGNIWADGAPNAPASPVAGTTYAKSNISGTEINNGQPYGGAGDSARFNEILKRVTTLLNLSEQYGILPWCPTVDYPVGAFCTGSDGLIYKSVANPNLNQDPVATSGFWVNAFRSATETYSGLMQIATQATVNAGMNDTQAITSLKLAVRLAALLVNTALTGTPTCPTQAAGDNSTKIANTAFVTTANAGAWQSLTLLTGWTASRARVRLINNGANLQIDIYNITRGSSGSSTMAFLPIDHRPLYTHAASESTGTGSFIIGSTFTLAGTSDFTPGLLQGTLASGFNIPGLSCIFPMT